MSRRQPGTPRAKDRRSPADARAWRAGRDFASRTPPAAKRLSAYVPVAIVAVLGALLLVTLRVEILRLRYAVGDATTLERSLEQRKRSVTVLVQSARDPLVLRKRAGKLGLVAPERLIHLAAHESAAAGAP